MMPDGTSTRGTSADVCDAARGVAGSAGSDVKGAFAIAVNGKLSGSLKGRVRALRETARPLYNHPGGAHNLNFF
jgi:hypothetical protein